MTKQENHCTAFMGPTCLDQRLCVSGCVRLVSQCPNDLGQFRLASMPDREAIIRECIDVASRYDDCGVSFVIEKLRDLALSRAQRTDDQTS